MKKSKSFLKFLALNIGRFIPDRIYLKIRYKVVFKKTLNLHNPLTYNEKLQWIKLHDRNSLYTNLVDKFEVKNFVKEKIGSNYIVPTLGAWSRFDHINFDALPNEFVLKCTHDSGSVFFLL